MRKIPGGRFTMGRTYSIKDVDGLFKEEVPAHPVDISPFRMGATSVTVGMWREYVSVTTGRKIPKTPVENSPVLQSILILAAQQSGVLRP
jgi:formylglycine-generating enzyme required for sulfatase activity